MPKIQRKFLAHYIDAGQDSYIRLGRELEAYSPKLSACVEKTKNILGQTQVYITGYEKTAPVKTYYARQDDPLFARLQAIIDGDLVLDALQTSVVEVRLWEGSGSRFPAVRELAYMEVTSYGGDGGGYQIPFILHHTGIKEKGTFDVSTKTFTADSGEQMEQNFDISPSGQGGEVPSESV